VDQVSPPGQPAFGPEQAARLGAAGPADGEYQAVFRANLADLATGGEGVWPTIPT